MNHPIRCIGVIGTGTQGAQIAFRCAIEGYEVRAFDAVPEARESAATRIQRWLDQRVLDGQLTAEQAWEAMARLQIVDTMAGALQKADLIIEAVPENLQLKRDVWQAADALAPPPALLTSNSSSIPSSRMAVVTQREDRTFSLNFDFPVEDSLVELMWNERTSDETKDAARAFLTSLGMTILETKGEIQGFSFNRVWRAIKKECLHLYAGGYCDVDELDRHFMLTFGTASGPFSIMDKIGLDVVRDIEMSYYAESGNPSDMPPQALLDLIDRGWLGVKTGRGFYTYSEPTA